MPDFCYGFPEWRQTRKPPGPFAVTQTLLSSLIITLHVLCFITLYFVLSVFCFFYLVASINKLEFELSKDCCMLRLKFDHGVVYFKNLPYRSQARNQELKKGGGGFFERERKLQTTLTRIFNVLESESHGIRKLGRNFSENSEIQTLFQPKNR